jgi:hypothetical protein
MTEIAPVLRDLLGSELSGALDFSFARMRIAEEEIAAATKRWPTAARRIRASFLILRPSSWMRGSEELYRRHCRELLARIKRGDDVGPGTDAEVCWVISQASLAAPPDCDHAHAYARAFKRAFPEHADVVGDLGRESYPGSVDELLERLRRKIGEQEKRGKR